MIFGGPFQGVKSGKSGRFLMNIPKKILMKIMKMLKFGASWIFLLLVSTCFNYFAGFVHQQFRRLLRAVGWLTTTELKINIETLAEQAVDSFKLKTEEDPTGSLRGGFIHDFLNFHP